MLVRFAMLVLPLALSAPAAAREIPAFARRFGLSCQTCHNPFPMLTAFGEAFAGNGFRLASGDGPPDTIATGDPLLTLPSSLPLAIRLDAYVRGFANGRVATDMQTPWNLKILSGGALTNTLSYYLYFFFYERGEVGGIEDAFVYANDMFGAPVDLAVGQFQVSDPLFKRELRLAVEDYVVYRTRVGLQPADLTYDRGLMAIADVGGFTVTGALVNGNGKGPAQADRRLDDGVAKNGLVHVTRDLAPFLRLGAVGYYGRQVGSVGAAPEVLNTVRMVGGDATISAGAFELNAQVLHREDDAPTFTANEPVARMDGGFAELVYRPAGSRWYALALYNRVQSNLPLLDFRLGGPANVDRYESLTGGAGWLWRRNVRLFGEVSWDREQEQAGFTIGLVTAF